MTLQLQELRSHSKQVNIYLVQEAFLLTVSKLYNMMDKFLSKWIFIYHNFSPLFLGFLSQGTFASILS